MAIKGLNHAVLYVRNLERSVKFYQEVLGFQEVARMNGRMAFLRTQGSENHHDLGLMALGDRAPSAPAGSVGLYHLAWQVETIEDLAEAAEILQQHQAFRGSSHHGASLSLYGADPDGNEFEIMWLIPKAEWGEFADKAVVLPLNLAQELQRFSHP